MMLFFEKVAVFNKVFSVGNEKISALKLIGFATDMYAALLMRTVSRITIVSYLVTVSYMGTSKNPLFFWRVFFRLIFSDHVIF